MKKSRFSDEQIVGFLKQAEAGIEAAMRMVQVLAISERRACRYAGLSRPSVSAASRPS
jgi:hypothetical protein